MSFSLNPSGPPDHAPRTLAGSPMLSGDLPCLRCRYNLSGLSVRSVCPECGLPVRVTILAMVDPQAGELQPIGWRRTIAAGLLVWAVGAVLAALCVWALRGAELAMVLGWPVPRQLVPSWLPAFWAAVSGVGALALVRPHGRISPGHVLCAVLGVLVYIPLVYVLWRIHGVIDAVFPDPYLRGAEDPSLRAMWRLIAALCVAVIALALRPNWLLLVSRSRLMRTGRVERQALPALLLALALTALGDALRFASPFTPVPIDELLRQSGMLCVAAGSLTLTFAILGMLRDVIRLQRPILSTPLTLGALVRPPGGNTQ